MKKLIVTLSLIIIAFTASPQAVLEHTYPSGTLYNVTKLTNYGWVYPFIPNNSPKRVDIYSVNHTLITSINMQIPTGYSFASFCGVSDNLFNSDNKIEILFSYYKTSPTLSANLVLYNEDGDLKQFFAGQGYGHIFNIDGVHKLSTNGWYSDSTSSIYSLPGTMVEIPEPNYQTDFFSVYPNPCSDHLYIDVQSYPVKFFIIDLNGRVIKEQVVINQRTIINTSNLLNGNYIYIIRCSSGRESTGKIVLSR